MASAFRDSRTAPDSLGSRWLSGWRGGSCASFVRPDRRSCKRASFGRLAYCIIAVRRRGELGAQLAQQTELGLEIDVMRQLQVLDKTGRLHVVGVRQHKLFVLRGRLDGFAKLARPQGAI